MRTPTALAIAGSDSGGGAGVQADLKAFARCGVHGTTAITAITAQNTVGVSAIHPVPPGIILAQVRAVLGDIGADAVKVGMLATAPTARAVVRALRELPHGTPVVVDAVKVGMLGSAETAVAVARALDELPAGTPVVVDPVMVAESGARLLDRDARRVLIEQIIPRATVLTPNLPEARAIAGAAVVGRRSRSGGDTGDERAEAEELIRAVLATGPRCVVLTGGHRARAVDVFLDADGDGAIVAIAGKRHRDGAAHGSGCTHSSVLAAQLALGRSRLEAARVARALAGAAIGRGLRDLGAGAGPVDVLDLARMRAS
jgi:hydroxymethylpyrimidine/phosphomethylpyrimidine kinase